MDCQVRISEPALADLEDILEYSWRHFPGSTPRFGRDLLDHIFLLSKYPYLGEPFESARCARDGSHAA